MPSDNQQPEGEKQFSIQPIKESGSGKTGVSALDANLGPATTNELPPQEGTKEERQARKEALKKK